MAECINKTKSEIIIFIDSDSFVEAETTRQLVKFFVDKKVAAVA
jgi:cellulose synthase/poly-beta-1,6-N-acetylglucosamine synthase-like glycosyltransferase